jgi:protein tyrosine phosphatase type 4A
MSSIDKSFTYIKHDVINLYISETPNDSSIDRFIIKLKNNNIKHVVRLCGQTYNQDRLIQSNINFYDWDFADGSVPSNELIQKWNQLLKLNESILVHCSAGLGRAPLLVTISLIEKNMGQIDAINFVREKRPGALNSKQIDWLIKYKPKKKSLFKKLFG